jgi:hypothetical protein
VQPCGRSGGRSLASWHRIPLFAALALLSIRTPLPSGATSYGSLLPAVLTPAPDPVFGAAEHEYAMTYALVLSASLAAGDQDTAGMAYDWLVADRRPTGWGTPWAWDPFADGTTNPAHTSYAITTALAIDALLDAGRFGAADAEVLVRWARASWSDGFYWYSVRRQDAIYTPNVSAMLAGVTARALAGYAELFKPADRQLLRQRVHASFARLVREAPAWPYSDLQLTPNDLSHQAYILWGGERYRDAGGDPGWSRAEALASLDRYWQGGKLGPFPAGTRLSEGMQRLTDSPWMVSGSGMALAFVATWDSGGLAPWRQAAVRAASTIAAAPRFTAHAVLGQALAERIDRNALR